jgi:hypothetical protein
LVVRSTESPNTQPNNHSLVIHHDGKVIIEQISMEQISQSCDEQANEDLKLTLMEEKHKQGMKAMLQGMNQQFIQIMQRGQVYE